MGSGMACVVIRAYLEGSLLSITRVPWERTLHSSLLQFLGSLLGFAPLCGGLLGCRLLPFPPLYLFLEQLLPGLSLHLRDMGLRALELVGHLEFGHRVRLLLHSILRSAQPMVASCCSGRTCRCCRLKLTISCGGLRGSYDATTNRILDDTVAAREEMFRDPALSELNSHQPGDAS